MWFFIDAISENNPRVIDDCRARKLANDLKRCSYYETCATYGLNVERVFQDGEWVINFCQSLLVLVSLSSSFAGAPLHLLCLREQVGCLSSFSRHFRSRSLQWEPRSVVLGSLWPTLDDIELFECIFSVERSCKWLYSVIVFVGFLGFLCFGKTKPWWTIPASIRWGGDVSSSRNLYKNCVVSL